MLSSPLYISSCCAPSFWLAHTTLQIRALSDGTHLPPFIYYPYPVTDSQPLLLVSVLSHGELRNCLCPMGSVFRLAQISSFYPWCLIIVDAYKQPTYLCIVLASFCANTNVGLGIWRFPNLTYWKIIIPHFVFCPPFIYVSFFHNHPHTSLLVLSLNGYSSMEGSLPLVALAPLAPLAARWQSGRQRSRPWASGRHRSRSLASGHHRAPQIRPKTPKIYPKSLIFGRPDASVQA